MKRELEKCNIHIINGLNGSEIVLNEFFEHSHLVQEQIISDIILPMLYDYESVTIKIGSKNN